VPPARRRRERPVVPDRDRERRPRQRDDDLEELPGGPQRRGGSTACEQRERGGEGERERKQ
jgi:hypothetical protein